MLFSIVDVRGESITINLFKVLFVCTTKKGNKIIYFDSGDYFEITSADFESLISEINCFMDRVFSKK